MYEYYIIKNNNYNILALSTPLDINLNIYSTTLTIFFFIRVQIWAYARLKDASHSLFTFFFVFFFINYILTVHRPLIMIYIRFLHFIPSLHNKNLHASTSRILCEIDSRRWLLSEISKAQMALSRSRVRAYLRQYFIVEVKTIIDVEKLQASQVGHSSE